MATLIEPIGLPAINDGEKARSDLAAVKDAKRKNMLPVANK